MARVGKRVLHLDANTYYGGPWASLPFPDLAQVTTGNASYMTSSGYGPEPPSGGGGGVEEHVASVKEEAKGPVAALEVDGCSVSARAGVVSGREVVVDEEAVAGFCVPPASRRFNVDVTAKVIPARGTLVDDLIASDVAKYLEFKAVEKSVLHVDGAFHPVPCSKSEIFASSIIKPLEKRKLMKFLKPFVIQDLSTAKDASQPGSSSQPPAAPEEEEQNEEEKEDDQGTLDEWMAESKISGKLAEFVKYAIALVDTGAEGAVSKKDAHGAVERYVQSMGRYGATAFLMPMYGMSEVTQAFCRLSAVFGGIYILNWSLSHLLVSEGDNRVVGLVTEEGKLLRTKHVVASTEYLPSSMAGPVVSQRARAIVIARASVFAEGSLILASIPPSRFGNANPIYLQQMDASTDVCPQGFTTLHVSMEVEAGSDGEEGYAVLESVLSELYDLSGPTAAAGDGGDGGDGEGGEDGEEGEEGGKPKAVWYGLFTQVVRGVGKGVPGNVSVVPDVKGSVCIDQVMQDARAIFDEVAEGEDYLPKMPSPDDYEWSAGDAGEDGGEGEGEGGVEEEGEGEGGVEEEEGEGGVEEA